jgi:hypothetical protein
MVQNLNGLYTFFLNYYTDLDLDPGLGKFLHFKLATEYIYYKRGWGNPLTLMVGVNGYIRRAITCNVSQLEGEQA